MVQIECALYASGNLRQIRFPSFLFLRHTKGLQLGDITASFEYGLQLRNGSGSSNMVCGLEMVPVRRNKTNSRTRSTYKNKLEVAKLDAEITTHTLLFGQNPDA